MEEICPFAGNPLDRVSERRRDAAWIAGLLADPAACVLPMCDLRPLVAGDAATLDWQPVEPWRGRIAEGAMLIFLGLDDNGRPHFAIDAGSVPSDRDLPDVRTLATQLPQGEAAILAEARSLLDWHARHGFCAQCGKPTKVEAAGWVRRCPECRVSHFPRTDPVVIMLAVRGEYGLLGRNKRRPGSRFSCLAGFMEPGETLEDAVRREVREESNIRVGRVKYLACQPWPFPSSLMTGFLCEALSDEITIDPEELAEARWFSRAEIRAMVERAATGPDDPSLLSLPGPVAIAHHICRRWSSGQDEI
ncbi:MAG TPA: NAD(+) diphosphatase [Stellaceae bacterium]|nr:NAD(+) diphosphatase [Stellaceae bacterium]